MTTATTPPTVPTPPDARDATPATPPPPARVPTLSVRDLAVGSLFALGSVAVTSAAWRDTVRMGVSNEELSYVLVAPLMIAWIAIRRAAGWRQIPLGNAWVGVAALVVGWALHWYGYFADPVLWRAGAVLAAAGAFSAGIGFPATWRFLPAFAATIFLVPIGPNGRYRLAVPLQEATARATQVVCDVLGIDVDRAGSMLAVNGKEVAVAEACNGMRMVLTLFMVVYVVAFSLRLPAYVRAFLLLASPIVAIVANVARLVPTVWLFGNASPATAVGFHDVSGWVMTILAFLVLMGLFRLFEEAADEDERDESSNPTTTIVVP
jgi:exosortase